MHGRLKIKTTAQQQAEKQKEREEKRKSYLGLLLLADQNNKSEKFEEFMKLSLQVLLINPDLATFWNNRRRLILTRTDDKEEVLNNELEVTQNCLLKNPKSYGAWHHRSWVLATLITPPWDTELELCDNYLKKDERNFHCWDHRSVVVTGSKREPKDELRLSKQLIELNLSNYSAWHYRSKLLPKVYPPAPGSSHPLSEDSLVKELNTVVEAVFTDPSDQSPWFFLRWLINQCHSEARPCQVGLSASTIGDGCMIVCVYTGAVCVDDTPGVCVDGNNQLHLTWNTPGDATHSCVWVATLKESLSSIHEVSLAFSDSSVVTLVGPSDGEVTVVRWLDTFTESPSGRGQLSDVTHKTLQEIKDNCQSLDELDPDNKWVLLTLVDVMWALGIKEYIDQIVNYLQQLQKLDPLRRNYYSDTKSKLHMELALKKHIEEKNSSKFSLTDCELSRLSAGHNLSCYASVDLQHNSLTSISPLRQLVMCRELNLDGNVNITTLEPISQLINLSILSLKCCDIKSIEFLLCLKRVINLKVLDIGNNPICNITDVVADVRGILCNGCSLVV